MPERLDGPIFMGIPTKQVSSPLSWAATVDASWWKSRPSGACRCRQAACSSGSSLDLGLRPVRRRWRSSGTAPSHHQAQAGVAFQVCARGDPEPDGTGKHVLADGPQRHTGRELIGHMFGQEAKTGPDRIRCAPANPSCWIDRKNGIRDHWATESLFFAGLASASDILEMETVAHDILLKGIGARDSAPRREWAWRADRKGQYSYRDFRHPPAAYCLKARGIQSESGCVFYRNAKR